MHKSQNFTIRYNPLSDLSLFYLHFPRTIHNLSRETITNSPPPLFSYFTTEQRYSIEDTLPALVNCRFLYFQISRIPRWVPLKKSSFRNSNPIPLYPAVSQRPAIFSKLPFIGVHGIWTRRKKRDDERERKKKRERKKHGRGTEEEARTTKRRVVEERGSNGGVVRGSLVNARENWLLNLAAGMSSAPPGGWLAPRYSRILSLGSAERWRMEWETAAVWR